MIHPDKQQFTAGHRRAFLGWLWVNSYSPKGIILTPSQAQEIVALMEGAGILDAAGVMPPTEEEISHVTGAPADSPEIARNPDPGAGAPDGAQRTRAGK